jgi:hypothetical protein
VPRRCFLGRLRDKGSVAQCALLEAHRATEQGHSPKLAPELLGWHHALSSYRNAGTGEKATKMRRVAQVERSSSGTQVAFGRAAIGATGIGAVAVGATAIGALAIGALAIRAFTVKRGRIERLNIEGLEVGQLHVRELVIEQEQRPSAPLRKQGFTERGVEA